MAVARGAGFGREARSHTQPGLEKVRGGQRPGRRPQRCSGSKPTWRGGHSGLLSLNPDVDAAPLPATRRSCWPIQNRVSDPETFLGKKVTCSQWRPPNPKRPHSSAGKGVLGGQPPFYPLATPASPPALVGGEGLGLTARAQKGALSTHLALLCPVARLRATFSSSRRG